MEKRLNLEFLIPANLRFMISDVNKVLLTSSLTMEERQKFMKILEVLSETQGRIESILGIEE